jgi:DNA-binding Lrp family transcriptional regulator
MKIDKQDRRILEVLQQQCRISSQELSEKLDISAATCWRRIKALEQNGVIKSYNAILDRRKLGFEISAFVSVSIERRYANVVAEIEAAFLGRPEVMECYVTTGEADFTLRVVAKNVEDYELFLKNFLFKLPDVKQVRSSIALNELKQSTILPLSKG